MIKRYEQGGGPPVRTTNAETRPQRSQWWRAAFPRYWHRGGLLSLLMMMAALGWLSIAFLPVVAPAVAQTPASVSTSPPSAVVAPLPPGVPVEPFLMLDTGMHTAPVTDVAVDTKHGLIATASLDKTVRLWDLETGHLTGRLTVPLGEGPEGILHSLAMAPNGSRMIAGGFTGASWDDGTFSLYTWGLPDQTMMRLKNLSAAPAHMRYRPDGKIFVVGFLSGQGIGVFSSGGKFLWQDRNYDDANVRQLAFGPDGRLAVSSDDGTLRLYNARMELVAQRRLEGPGIPYGVSFSPQGVLAVGFSGAARVELLDGDTLKPRTVVALPPGHSGETPLVQWFNDGRGHPLVAAAGTRNRKGGSFAIAYNPRSRSWMWSVETGRDSASALAARPGGGLIFATNDPSWGQISGDGHIKVLHEAGLADFRDVADGTFALSADGLRLVLGIRQGGRTPITIDLVRGRVTENDVASTAVATPLPSGGGVSTKRGGRQNTPDAGPLDAGPLDAGPLDAEPSKMRSNGLRPHDDVHWRNRTDPVLDGVPLSLDPGEAARSAVRVPLGPPGVSGTLLGADFTLRLFDAQKNQVARRNLPATAWGVTVAQNAPLAVAALGDGSVRWYSLAPGDDLAELAAVFYHPVSQRWVVWTPSGFFAHSPGGGQDLVSHVLNRSKAKSPIVVDFAQLYRLYHRPDLVWAYLRDPLGQRPRLRMAQAKIGDLRHLLRRAPPPEVDLVALCDPVEDQPTRGFVPVAVSPAPSKPAPSTSAPVLASPSVPAVEPPKPDHAMCRPPTALTRAFRRTGDRRPDARAPTAEDQALGVLTLAPGQTRVVLRFSVTDTGAGIGAIDVFRDGRNVGRTTATRAFRRTGDHPPASPSALSASGSSASAPPLSPPVLLDREIALVPGANPIEIRAYNGAGVYGKTTLTLMVPDASVTVASRATGGAAAAAPLNRLWLVAVGINDYANDSNDLAFAVPDARAVATEIATRSAPFYDSVHVTELYDEAATRPALETTLAGLAGRVERTDSLIVYLAGHGMATEDGLYRFLTPNAFVSPGETGLGQNRLVELLGEIQASHKMVFLDTCHGGAFEVSAISGNLYNETGNFILAAASSEEEALDSYDGRNGVFAHAILSGLRHDAAVGRDRMVSALTLGAYVRDEVGYLATEKGHAQQAVFQGNNTDKFMLGKADDP